MSNQTYNRVKYVCFFIGLLLNVLFLVGAHVSGVSVWLHDRALQVLPAQANLIYFTCFYVLLNLLHLPLDIFTGFIWEHKYNFSTQTFGQWLLDDVKRFFLGLALFLISMSVLYIFLERFPVYWWLLAGLFWLFLTVFLARITPQVIIPIFLKYQDLDHEELRARIKDLFKQASVTLKDVYLVNLSSKTKKPNAFMCGLGKSRRVVLSDTLVKDFSVPEIETVVAHELAHYKHGDIIKFTLIHAAVTLGGLWLVDRLWKNFFDFPLADPSYLPLLALALGTFSFITTPLLNALSRYAEREADRFSITMTDKPKDFISMIQKLGEMSLAEFEPGWLKEMFFYDHPPIGKRIKFAQKYLK